MKMETPLQQAFRLRKEQKFAEALKIYDHLWKENKLHFDEWAGWSYAYCYSRLNNHRTVLDICRKLYKRFKESEMISSLYAKAIYYTEFVGREMKDLKRLKKATNAIYKLTPPTNPYSYAPRAIFKLCKHMMKQQLIPWEEINKYLQLLDPDLLDNRPYTMTDSRGKPMELASPREEWYSLMIRTHAGLNQHEQLLNTLQLAREQHLKWHYNNDIWFSRKEAFAYQHLGNNEKAEKILRKILLRKQDWFLVYDLAKVIQDKNEKLQLLCRAAAAKGKPEMKLKLYRSLYSELKEHDVQDTINTLHLCLIAALREENGWDVNPDLLKKIEDGGINPHEQGSSSKILKELIPFWKKKSGQEQKRQEGRIVTILPGGHAGFIKAGKNSYYFRTNAVTGDAQEGQQVSFILKDGYDKKKDRASKIAVSIKKKE